MLEERGDELGGKTIRRYKGRERSKEKAVVWNKVEEKGTAKVKRNRL